MQGLCLDSSVVVTVLLQERGWKPILSVVQRAEVDVVLPGPCLTESIEVVRRKGNQSSGQQLHATLTSLGRIEHPSDADWVRAAELLEISERNPGPPKGRADYPATLSLGDALILAITERLGFMVLTRDDCWRWMVDQGLLHVQVRVP